MSLFDLSAPEIWFCSYEGMCKSFDKIKLLIMTFLWKMFFVKEQLKISVENDNIPVVNKCKYLFVVNPSFYLRF